MKPEQKPDCILYNDYDVDTHRLEARIFQPGKGETGRYSRPVYALAPNGKFAVSLDIGRIPRRGYSYADVPVGDSLFPPDLDHDGLFLIDLKTGCCCSPLLMENLSRRSIREIRRTEFASGFANRR